ncbi:hypothetical protein [Agriterribacter humi]|uniref:hypothetical protein n=1 Tax=Agriterribacter humi TaxID=1104781 RepID=UPI001264CF81|nr:hypothetical protein [Agriterribacter humi]
MFQIKINKSVKLDEVEQLYTQLYQHIKLDIVVDVLLPVELDSSYIGIVPTLYQFVFTWMRYEKSGKLLIDISNPEATDYEELYENELIFPLVSLVWNENEVFDKTGKINLRKYLKSYNTIYFDRMKAVNAQKNWKLLLTNFDHLSEDRGILPCFEINGVFTANETTLSNNLKGGIQQLLGYSKDAQNSYDEIKVHLMGIVYELMKNTFEWGNKDENNVPLDPSLRGLLIKFYKKKRRKLVEEFKIHKGLTTYFKSDVLKENSLSEIYFLEIDVFDSGVGFVKKYKSLNPSEKLSDIDIIKKCLIKHNTSAKGLEKGDKGIGLDRILTILECAVL